MPFPVARVDIAFDEGPYVASPAWTEVTQYVREMTIDRGRDDDWGTFSGDATVTLDNRTRLFDPFYTSGTYYGKLLPRRQIRIIATYGGVDYPVFRGYIQGWPPVWTEAGKDSTVTLSCMDALGLLTSETLPADWSRKYILSTNPRHYWPCDEPIVPYTTGTLRDLGSYPQDITLNQYATQGTQLAVGLVNSSVQGTVDVPGTTVWGSTFASTNFSVAMWAIFDTDSVGPITGEYGNCIWQVSFESSTSKYKISIEEQAAGHSHTYRTNATFDGGTARHIAFSFNPSTNAVVIYIDGIIAPNTASTVGGFVVPLGERLLLGTGQFQQIVIWTELVSQTTIQNIYKYSTVNLPETTAARFTRLIGETAFPASLTSGPSAPASSVLDITDDAPKLAGELQKVADSEYAPLFVDRSGVVTLYYQNQIRTQSRSIVSQGTYGAGGYSMGQDVAIAYDGDSMRNQANITMSGGGVYIQDNATSQSTYGAAQESLETQVSTYADAQDIGAIVTGWGGQVYPKADPFEVVLSPNADWSNALDRELNDRITLVVQPPTGNAITTPMLLQRISHSVVPGEWRTTFEGSARWAAVFIVNQSLVGGTDLLG